MKPSSNKAYIFDLEANGLLEEADTIWCGVFSSLDGEDVHKFTPDQMPAMIAFMDKTDKLIGHFVHGYDFPLLEKVLGYVYKGEKVDTVVISRLLNPNRPTPWSCPVKNKPHSVEVWGWRVGRGKPEHNEWDKYSDEMLYRCSEDCEIQRLIYHELVKEAQNHNWGGAIWLTGRLFEIVSKQAQYGWLVDRNHMDFSIRMCSKWIDKIDRALKERLPIVLDIKENKIKGVYNYVKKPFLKSGARSASVCTHYGHDTPSISGPFSRIDFRPLDPNSRVEAIRFLLDSGWKPKDWNYNKETNEKTSPKLSKDDPFEGVNGKEGQLFAKRVQIKHRRSNIEGLIKHIRSDGRIPSIVSGLAETGRAKHSIIVNIPNAETFFGKWMRKIFIAKGGRILIGTDSAGCQNRMLAARVGDDAFTKTLIEGKKSDKTSIHFVNQRAIFEETGIHVKYGTCKTLNYAFMFGASDNKLGSTLGGSKDLGGKIRKAMLGVSTAFGDLVERLTKEWRRTAKTRPNKWGGVEFYNGYLEGLDGRPIFIDSEHKILVYILQSDEAIMMSLAYVMLHGWLIGEGYVWGEDWAYVNWNHDEYTIECKPEMEERVRFLSEKAITEAGKYYNIACPHEGESAVGLNWYDIH